MKDVFEGENWWLRSMGYIEAGFAEVCGQDTTEMIMAWVILTQSIAALLLFIGLVILSGGWLLWSIPALLTLILYKAYKRGKKKKEERS